MRERGGVNERQKERVRERERDNMKVEGGLNRKKCQGRKIKGKVKGG